MFSRSTRILPRALKAFSNQHRKLHIHEYQSQELLRKFGIKVPNGDAAESPSQAAEIARTLGGDDFVVKSQILAGGRGRGTFSNGFQGGVHTATSIEEVEHFASLMLGNRLITKQTGPTGQIVNKVLVAQRHYIRREAYFAILLDRKTSCAVMIGSRFGGMDIEHVAETNPNAIIKVPVKLEDGVTTQQCQQIAAGLGFPVGLRDRVVEQIRNMFELFVKTDATQIEINPMVETSSGELLCADAKINFDDNASFRQKDIFALRDYSQEDPREVEASKFDLNFIGLDGSIGCLVNGAGLAMATLDVIKLNGGSPANFLDVGGGATEKQVTEALKIIANDPKVNVILINIFGGIMRCDVIALGILNAVQHLNLRIPLVVRLSGTNVDKAVKILEDSAMKVITASDLGDAADKAVRVASIVEMAKQAELTVHFELPL